MSADPLVSDALRSSIHLRLSRNSEFSSSSSSSNASDAAAPADPEDSPAAFSFPKEVNLNAMSRSSFMKLL